MTEQHFPDEGMTSFDTEGDSRSGAARAEGATSDIEAALAKLNESSQKMGAAMYAAGEADASAAGGATGTGDSDEDVVDAEIVEDDTDNEGDTK